MKDPLMQTYGRQDIAFVRGEGAWLVDEQGNRYLDALSGLGVVALGHANPVVAKTLTDQSTHLLHTSNLYRIPAQEKLAAALAEISGMDNMFFGNSGAEANECAIKIARLFGKHRGIEEPTIIVTEASFHGRTLATLTATGSRKVHAGFEPLVNGFVRVPFDDVEAVRQIAAHSNNIVAMMVEPIQGEAGIRVPDDNYLKDLRAICDDHNWLLILDEVQSGNARTGTYFCYQQSGILPDLVTTAKGLGNGFPIGVCLARGEAAEIFKPGNHGSTFGGNPLACSVGLTVVNEIKNNNIADRARELGDRMQENFRKRLGGLNNVKDIRGKGLMLGIELDKNCTELVGKALARGLLINVTSENVIRLLPPLIITDEEADQICNIVCSLIEEA
ncbi:MAG: aspartate aminotransferase family protein [Proteobacteria bacterium]|nr:aspartate aminotransferase family protein [Pseudomonadota bacterium]